jgi:hypothetical protein
MRRFGSLDEAFAEGFEVYDETPDEYVVARWREEGVAADFATAPKPPPGPLEKAIRNLIKIVNKRYGA